MIDVIPRGVARIRLGDRIIEVRPDKLDRGYVGQGDGTMGGEHHLLFTYTDDLGRQAEWVAVEHPAGSLAHIGFHSLDFQLVEDFSFDQEPLENDKFPSSRQESLASSFNYGRIIDDIEKRYGALGGLDAAVRADSVSESETPKNLPPDDLWPSSQVYLKSPEQSPGPQWALSHEKIVPRSNQIGPNPLFSVMHARILGETERAVRLCGTLRNKYPSLWDALGDYATVIARDARAIDGTELYATGIILRAEFEEAGRRGSRSDEADPELSGAENAALQRVVQLHAPFIQLTEIGSHLTALANRELRTSDEATELTRKALVLANALTKYPEVVDASSMNRVKAFLEAPETDPTVTKKRAFSIDSLRNLTVVSGTITLLRHFPSMARVGGAGLGGLIGGSLGAMLGSSLGEMSSAGPMSDIRDRAVEYLEAVERGETTAFDPVTRMFRSLRQEFSDFIHRDGMEEWFNALHADLDYKDSEGQSVEPVWPDVDEEESPEGKYSYYLNQAPLEGLGFETSQWRVDDKGLDGVGSNGQDMTTREILGLSPMTDAATDTVHFEYSIVTHFAFKRWCDVDGLVEAWVHAFAYHSEAQGVEIDPDALDMTIAAIPGGRDALSERTLSKVDWLREQVGDRVDMEDNPEAG